MQTEKLQVLSAKRNNSSVIASLEKLKHASAGSENIMPIVLECVENLCTLGEIADVLRGVYGEYK
jgi:methylmalonyl-CoA mutase N-terminal domain/subunit